MFSKKRTEPIINSLMDTDFYKFTMGRVVFERYPDVQVQYGLTNRTKSVRLGEHIKLEQLREELEHVRSLRFNNSEIHYLRGTNEYSERMFPEAYLEHLKNLSLDECQIEERQGNIILVPSGKWSTEIYWETIVLPIIDQLYFENLTRDLSRFELATVYAEGQRRLLDKIRLIRQYPGLTFSDFGTRRRFSRKWQDYVVGVLAEELPGQFIGTSNVYLAMKYGLMPIGTSAHEMYMVLAGIMGETDEGLRESHNLVLRDWWETYGWGLSIALTDTFGTNFFFHDMTKEQAKKWKGLRQDSGDPMVFGEKAINFYKNYGIDPREKLLVFSDGLDTESMIAIHKMFNGRIRHTFGWGTNLTNDLGFQALSLVIKAIRANDCGLVKLSDNIAKAIGDPADIERYKQVFDYNVNFTADCRY